MSARPVSAVIAVAGVVDHARAEALAVRLRAAERNGVGEITLDFAPGTVLASSSLLGFVLRAGAVLRARGGRVALSGDSAPLAELEALGVAAALAGGTP